MEDYRRIADTVAADIAAGRLRPGDRLAPQRAFARVHRIADSTAARVYRELARRGLTVGEVGRGTYVRAAQHAPGPALAEPADPARRTRVNLELNYPEVPGQAALLARSLEPLLRPDVLSAALAVAPATGSAPARDAFAALLARGDFRPDPAGLLFAGNGRQAIAGALAALVPPGGRLGVEALTYPLVKSVAARLGSTLVPLAGDAYGLHPDAVREAHRSAPLHAVYLQPTLHNPLGVTMAAGRRAELAGTLRALDLWAVEDAVWSFLLDDGRQAGLPPLAALAPERTLLVDSLSKRLAPGLTTGLVLAPPAYADRVAAALRSGGWTAGGFALNATVRWLLDGVVTTVVEAKRRDAAARQALLREHLDGFRVRADPASYFAWWELPEGWRAETFLAAAVRHGIAVTPAAAFAVGAEGAHGAAPAPNAVRVALAAPATDDLAYALGTLAAIARGAPEDSVPD
ncbi:PLP-dependent aminotransferase family protein [Streptomyces paromomycinus]|uniref:GntR family transcriptional regulator n=1 Tax=Streptomyces paromomycinus TaxID=92743 RepID=A0A401WAW9_STREY|nr:PLP-dependent aminotransferase family protein [Streptomyces paromomycinus]GCD46451.1 GntR family transcriptional regulator [Streptomyces paromomycinus]